MSHKNGKTKAQNHAAPAAHCTNHYTRSVMQLEGVLEERLAQLSLLMEENSALKRREAALQSAVGSLAGSVSAVTNAVLVSTTAEAVGVLHATVRPDGVTPSIPNHKSFLVRMQQREAAVQHIMSQLGGVEYEELYSSWLLRRAFSCPKRASALLAMSKAERVAFVLQTVQKMGLMLGKYDLLHHPTTAMGTPREQLDRLVDDVNERTLAFCLLAPPNRQLEMAYLNLETGLPEPYPRGWWAVVIDAMQLTDEQKAALKICWDKVKPIKLALTAKYELLSSQLTELQRKQMDQQREFKLQAEHAIDAAITSKAERRQRQQELKQQQQELLLQQQQQQHQLSMQPQAQLGMQQQAQPAAQWQQQQQPSPQPMQQQWLASEPLQQQQQPLQQQQQLVRSSTLDALAHNEQDLFQFCRALLGSELDGLLDGSATPKDSAAVMATATSAPPPQMGQPGVDLAAPDCLNPAATWGGAGAGAHAGAGAGAGAGVMPTPAELAAAQQQQMYASRMAPLQVQQQQRQFMQFSPAVAAAAAASDQNLWLQGLRLVPSPADASHSSPSPPAATQTSDAAADNPSAPSEVVADSEEMVIDSSRPADPTPSTGHQHRPQQHQHRPPRHCKSHDSGSFQSTMSSPTSSLSAGGTDPTASGGAGGVTAAHRRSSSELWQELAAGGTSAPSVTQKDLLLQVTGREQRKLERQMDKVTAQLKMQQYCMHTYVLNICSKKQMALKYVNCYPWVPESFSMCEALDEMGW